MLVLSKEYLDEHQKNTKDLRLFGQESNGGVWSISKMNMLLHGIAGADLKNGDTLADPLHTEGGELMRFDRVISNPPFSQNYSQDGLPFKERFRFGFCPRGRQEGRSHVRAAHARGAAPRRHGRHGHAPRRAVPRRRRAGDPHRHPRRRPARRRHRPRPEPVLRHRHPRLHPRAPRPGRQAEGAQGQGAVHQRRSRVLRGTRSELPPPGAHREGRQHLEGGRLYFHWQTILLPPRIVDYVVVHELVHLREPHHTPAFWRAVERILPDWAPRRRWLAEHGHELLV